MIVPNPRRNPGECDVCHFPTKDLKDRPSRNMNRHGMTEESMWDWLCQLCAHSPRGGDFYRLTDRIQPGEVACTVLYVGNVILAALKSQAKGGDSGDE